MTDLNGIIEQIEGLLGSEGTPELATAMLPLLTEAGYVTFTADRGFVMDVFRVSSMPIGEWNNLLAEAGDL